MLIMCIQFKRYFTLKKNDFCSNLLFQLSFGINIIIIIITLFQEDNIFGTNASLTYGPRIQMHTCV